MEGGGAYAPPSFGISVNPIQIKGGRLCPPYYYFPSIFLDDAASLILIDLRFNLVITKLSMANEVYILVYSDL